jgi:hypothetical protein
VGLEVAVLDEFGVQHTVAGVVDLLLRQWTHEAKSQITSEVCED